MNSTDVLADFRQHFLLTDQQEARCEAPFKACRCGVGSQHCGYENSWPPLPN